MTVPLRPPIAYFGSKVRIAPRIVEYLPPHRGYVEPYCGSLAVLFAKPPTVYECVNDLDGDLVLFWRMLRDRLPDLERVCRLTPHAREEYAQSWPITDDVDDLERARRVWVKLTQGRGGSLRTTGWRYHEGVAGRSSSMPRTLAGYLGRFAPAAERLMGVSLENRPALEVIERYGRDPGQLLYVDPPYPFDVRGRRAQSHGSDATYRHDMGSEEEHRELAAALNACGSTVVLSGYPGPLYDELYAGWDRVEIASGTGQNADAGWQLRTEVLWCNRPLARQVGLWEVEA
jgi:DNA adenine methylase